MDKILQYYNREQTLHPQLAGQDSRPHPSPRCFSSVFSWQSETGWASMRTDFSYFGEQTFHPSYSECRGALGPSQMHGLVSGMQASPLLGSQEAQLAASPGPPRSLRIASSLPMSTERFPTPPLFLIIHFPSLSDR